MDKATIEKAVDSAFDSCLSEIYPLVSQELYPAAFANEYSWLRVKKHPWLYEAAEWGMLALSAGAFVLACAVYFGR